MDDWSQFDVEWDTTPSPACTYYRGTRTVWAEDKEAAGPRAQRLIQREMFPEMSPRHIRILKITEA